jgi:hypothetical protein
MLSQDCRDFRSEFHPGADREPDLDLLDHRRSCPGCAAYAATLRRAAGARLPLPAGLKDRLRAVGPEPRPALPAPLPQRPLPPGLRERLQAVPQQRSRRMPPAGRPPFWVHSPRYAVAASYVLAVLLTGLFGDPVARGRTAVHIVGREIGSVLQRAEALGSEWKGITSELLSRDQQKESGPSRDNENNREPERRMP